MIFENSTQIFEHKHIIFALCSVFHVLGWDLELDKVIGKGQVWELEAKEESDLQTWLTKSNMATEKQDNKMSYHH